MKKFFLFFALFNIVSSGFSYAQERRHELELGIGVWNLNEIINTASDIIVSSIPSGAEMADGNSLASMHASYRYRITPRIGAGGLFAFDYAANEALLNGNKIGDFRKHHYTLAAEADFIYLNYQRLKLYALAGLGGTIYNLNYRDLSNVYENDSESKAYFTFQFTPVGIKYGERFGGFLELGFGYRGIVNAGVFLRL